MPPYTNSFFRNVNQFLGNPNTDPHVVLENSAPIFHVLFGNSFYHGYLSMILSLILSEGEHRLNVNPEYEEAFKQACDNGNTAIITHLLESQKNP